MGKEPQIGRVSGLYIDFERDDKFPRRGDRLSSGKTIYYVLHARRVKRKDPNAKPRIQMRVMQKQDMPEGLSNKLILSAIRGHGGSLLFTFYWYPRKKKTITFERYMQQGFG